MATALQSGEDRLAGDALSVSLILAAVAGTIFLVALQVPLTSPSAHSCRHHCPLCRTRAGNAIETVQLFAYCLPSVASREMEIPSSALEC